METLTVSSTRDQQRLDAIVEALSSHELDLLVCTLPKHVLLVSGYFPVVGKSVAIATRNSRILLIVPEDEAELAERSYADELIVYKPATLDRVQTAADAAMAPVQDAMHRLATERSRIGVESGAASEPSSYAGMNLFGGVIGTMLERAVPRARIESADLLLSHLAAVKTPREVERIRAACRIAAVAFQRGSTGFHAGMCEFEAAALVRTGFSECAAGAGVERGDGFAWCMSGPNSAKAAAAYARSRHRQLATGDLVLLHANSWADGYWTDITRTYVLGQASRRQEELFAAVFAARSAALKAIRPGARASEVDLAARDVMASRGFGKEFKHSTGHGVGFSAISPNAVPRIHPASQDILEEGMVFNVEPAIYIEDYGGIRHCDMLAVGQTGADLLTDFQSTWSIV
jgi:Xaa-Pro aminopeptidase